MNQVTIWDAWFTRQTTGKLVKEWPNGVTIDDERGVRHYATHDRIVTGKPVNATPATAKFEMGNLF